MPDHCAECSVNEDPSEDCMHDCLSGLCGCCGHCYQCCEDFECDCWESGRCGT